MANFSVISLFIALTFVMSTMVVSIPVADEKDVSGAKIESPNEQLTDELAATTTEIPDENSNNVDTTTDISSSTVSVSPVKMKSQRNYPIYYVNTKVNGKFGKSVRAFTSDEFVELYPLIKRE